MADTAHACCFVSWDGSRQSRDSPCPERTPSGPRAHEPTRAQPITLAKSKVRQRSGVSHTVTEASVLGLLSAYHWPNSGPR